ncbi:MAG: hypothetical protein V4510_07305 [bacterium]
MKTKTSLIAAVLCLGAVAAIPAPAAADPSVCGIDCLIICSQEICPTIRCLPLQVGVEVHSLGNHANVQASVNQYCQVSETGIPLPPYYCPCFPLLNIDPSQPTDVCVTVGVGSAPPTTQCIGVDPATGCLSANGATIACPLPPQCSYPPSPVGGTIGATIAYAEQVATIMCQAAGAVAGVAGQAVATTVTFVTSQIPCTGGCSFITPPWIQAYVNSLETIALGQGVGQAGLLCNFLLGPSQCDFIAAGPAPGHCPVPISRTDGGIVGDAERYAGGSCDLAQGGLVAAASATKTFTSNVGTTATGAVAFAEAYAAYELAQATAYAGTMTGYATTTVGIATTAVTATCTATTAYATGGSCPV